MADVFSQRSQEDVSISVYRLSELNIRLNRWLHDLPEHLQWSQWTAQERQLQHHTISLQYVYPQISHLLWLTVSVYSIIVFVSPSTVTLLTALQMQLKNHHGGSVRHHVTL